MQRDIGAYVDGLLGRPWHARDFNCWTLVRQTVRDLFGVEVPAVIDAAPAGRRAKAKLFTGHPARAGWVETDAPGPWAVALMHRRGAPRDLLEHSGVFLAIGGGRLLHVDDPHGVVFDSVFELPRLRTWAAPILLVPAAR